METISYHYGDIRKPETVVPLWDEPEVTLLSEPMFESTVIEVNGTETELGHIRDYLAFEELGFCGCGLPDEVDQFWLDQITSIVSDEETIDYLGYAGGLEFFTHTAISQGILNEDDKLTPLGKLAVKIIRLYCELVNETEVTEKPTYVESYGDQLTTANDRANWFALRLLAPVGFRREMEKSGVDREYRYQATCVTGKVPLAGGQYYWAYHVMEQMGKTEHGSSAPGWLLDEGYETLMELVKEFGIDNMSIFDLIQDGFVFSDRLADVLGSHIDFLKTGRPDINWDSLFPVKVKHEPFVPTTGYSSPSNTTMTFSSSVIYKGTNPEAAKAAAAEALAKLKNSI